MLTNCPFCLNLGCHRETALLEHVQLAFIQLNTFYAKLTLQFHGVLAIHASNQNHTIATDDGIMTVHWNFPNMQASTQRTYE